MRSINVNEITAGDWVKSNPVANVSSGYEGRVYKVARVNIGVMSLYQLGSATSDNPPKPLDLGNRRKSEIDFVKRGNEVYSVNK